MGKAAFAISAHPDDIEFMMSGTLLLLKDAGYDIHYMAISSGSLGSNRMSSKKTAATRRREAIASCAKAGAIYHESICGDLEIFYCPKLLAELVPVVREVSPEIILTHGPYDYMEDHVNAGRLAVSAAFCRGMKNFKCSRPQKICSADVAVYHSMPQSLCDQLGRPVLPDIYVDVESKIDKKREMLLCHKSQEEWLDSTQKLSFADSMFEALEFYGKMSKKFKYAEAWIRHDSRGFCAKGFNPLCGALGKLAKKERRL